MSKLNNLTDFLTSLANSFRTKLGTTDSINPQDFDSKVTAVYDKGKTDGYYSLYNACWNTIQSNGARTAYSNCFDSKGWTADNFKPKYSMTPTAAAAMFRYCNVNASLREICTEQGITIDFSNCTTLQTAFYGSSFTELPTIDLSSITSGASSGCFDQMSNLTTIEKIIFNETHLPYISTFGYCSNLTTVTFDGTLATGLNLSHTALNHNSLVSLIGVLKDYSGTATTKTITLGGTLLNKLSDAEKAVATAKGWTLA